MQVNATASKIRVFIVDDHQILIDGIKSLLKYEDHILICGEARSGEDALEMLETAEVDVVLTDVNMGGMSGIDLVTRISALRPAIGCIVLTMFNDKEIISSALEAGAKGYILKNTGRKEMLEAIEKVFQGELFYSDEVTKMMLTRFLEKKPAQELPENTLTARELEILSLIAAENTNAEIADKLFISERTVETHRKNVFHKTGSKTVAGLIKYAYEHKMISL
jgi:two-component system nitrate/nitrite response regulator NarL